MRSTTPHVQHTPGADHPSAHLPTLTEPHLGRRNPIEKAFSRVKQLIQDNADEAAVNPKKVLNEAFASIGPALGMAYTQNMLRVLESC